MFRVKLFNMPDINWVLKDRNCIKLYALEDIIINPNEVRFISFGDFYYEFESSVGVPYIPKNLNKLTLYYPTKSFVWKDKNKAQLVIKNKTSESILIQKGDHLANINLMSIQFFNLMVKNNNSDKGLNSCPIKIEFVTCGNYVKLPSPTHS